MANKIIDTRIATLRAEIERRLPEFVQAVTALATGDQGDATLLLHQDAFAADYQDAEYALFGMAIKYAGLHGLTVTVVSGDLEKVGVK